MIILLTAIVVLTAVLMLSCFREKTDEGEDAGHPIAPLPCRQWRKPR
ncbi:MAG: hypothetical protein PSX71_06775 [bacterium]|nr:hypothetical protein [bacterium]